MSETHKKPKRLRLDLIKKYIQFKNPANIISENAFIILAPLPFIFIFAEQSPFSSWTSLLAASVSSAACVVFALFSRDNPALGKISGSIFIFAMFATIFPAASENPFLGFIAIILGILFFVSLFSNDKMDISGFALRSSSGKFMRSAGGFNLIVFATYFFVASGRFYESSFIFALSLIISLVLQLFQAVSRKSQFNIIISALGLSAIVFLAFSHNMEKIYVVALISIFFQLVHFGGPKRDDDYWADILINNPARLLFTIFLGLSAIGAAVLSTPAASSGSGIDVIDAAFTSVSAVCVTGLIVLDTPNDFSLFGQIVILVLIQLGGLGIMSIATLALHSMGVRLSLKHERIISSTVNTERKDLSNSLSLILKFAFIVEAIGAAALAAAFYFRGEAIGAAAFRGVFTSVSAFCNAGFSLQSDSLMSYSKDPIIINTVALLIIFGGVAPATSILLPKWIKGKTIPLNSKIPIFTTAILLVIGTLFILLFEWDGALADSNFFVKLQNAWFQSVTLRTAGFNSLDFALISNPVFILSLVFMFIGGSPGGAAGGFKTTTIAIIAAAFWANIRNKKTVSAFKRKISNESIQRAITIIFSYVFAWFLFVIMIQATQTIPAKDLIFEVVSALGTVGLSTGATTKLDNLGKIIIIATMFIGRIGPISLFMLLSKDSELTELTFPEEKISLN